MTNKHAPAAPVVTIVCPIFNSAAYLEEAVDSALSQDFRSFELLLVNDGSTDSSEAIARRYAERHKDKVRFLAHPDGGNHGVGATRNLGIRNARGKFCAFLDADDRWRPMKLREQLALFEEEPRIDLVAGTANYWRSWSHGADRLVPSGHVQNRLLQPPEASLKVYPLAKGAAPCPSDLLVRTAFVLAIGGFEEAFIGPLALYEDQAFLSKVYLQGNVYFDQRVWIDYRLHDQSTMHQQLAAGRYHALRQAFLRWFAGYLRTTRAPHAVRVSLSVQRAYLRYRAPRLARAARMANRLRRKLLGVPTRS